MNHPVARTWNTLRFLQLNCLAHALRRESIEEYDQRMMLHYNHIIALQPTLIALQEVDGQFSLPNGTFNLPHRLVAGCSEVMPSPLGSLGSISGQKEGGTSDETWLLYDMAILSLRHHEILRFRDASQFALIAEFSLVSSDEIELLVVVQHAKAGRTDENERKRIQHSKELLQHFALEKRYQNLAQNGRLIWLGDFNAGPHSYGGRYPSEWYQEIIEPLRQANSFFTLESALRFHFGAEPAFTTFKYRDGELIEQTIDYIFYTPSGLEVVDAVRMPESNDMPSGGLPFERWGSDHLSLCVDLKVKYK
jgi:endonuclease/exonuclease/phosphatase family metal-dependent hydrolase